MALERFHAVEEAIADNRAHTMRRLPDALWMKVLAAMSNDDVARFAPTCRYACALARAVTTARARAVATPTLKESSKARAVATPTLKESSKARAVATPFSTDDARLLRDIDALRNAYSWLPPFVADALRAFARDTVLCVHCGRSGELFSLPACHHPVCLRCWDHRVERLVCDACGAASVEAPCDAWGRRCSLHRITFSPHRITPPNPDDYYRHEEYEKDCAGFAENQRLRAVPPTSTELDVIARIDRAAARHRRLHAFLLNPNSKTAWNARVIIQRELALGVEWLDATEVGTPLRPLAYYAWEHCRTLTPCASARAR